MIRLSNKQLSCELFGTMIIFFKSQQGFSYQITTHIRDARNT
jgi:hypothetical protein